MEELQENGNWKVLKPFLLSISSSVPNGERHWCPKGFFYKSSMLTLTSEMWVAGCNSLSFNAKLNWSWPCGIKQSLLCLWLARLGLHVILSNKPKPEIHIVEMLNQRMRRTEQTHENGF